MVTTRSSTGSLPITGKPSKKKRRTTKQHDDLPPDDSGPTVGDADKFSKLPYEILCMIWSYCQPVDLLKLCRTSRALRLYLTPKTAEHVWITSRENMSVVAQSYWPRNGRRYDSDDEDEIGPYEGQPWPRTYRVPPPPPYLNEIGWCAFLFDDKCPYCKDGWAYNKFYGTYEAACGACTNQRRTNIYLLKYEHKDKDVDIRYYSILPHFRTGKGSSRSFWKPTCDRLLREMQDFELSVGLYESAIKEWIVEKRKIIADHGEGKETEAKVNIWRQAHSYSRTLQVYDYRKRNTAMFLHCMKDSDFHPDDLRDFCRFFSDAFWLTSKSLMFDADAARKTLANQADKIGQIRRFREEHEQAKKVELASKKIREYISQSLAKADLAGKAPWSFDYTKHMPDVLSLPVVTSLVEILQKDPASSDASEIWSSSWTEFCAQMVEMEDDWLDMLLVLVVGDKRAEALNAHDYIHPVKTVFGCSNCNPKQVGSLCYPAVLDHGCFCRRADSPRFSDDSPGYYPKRSMHLDLSLIFYDVNSSRKYSSILAAIEQAGHPAPATARELNGLDLPGRFTCIDCPESDRFDMAWYTAKKHICEKTYYQVLQEDGELEWKTRKHQRLVYVVPEQEVETEI